MSVESAKQDVQVSAGKDLSTAVIQGVKAEVSPAGNVVGYMNEGVERKAVAGYVDTAAKGTKISISQDFNTVARAELAADGSGTVYVELAIDGSVIVYTDGSVKVKPARANDSAATKAAQEDGDKMEDGTVDAGISTEGEIGDEMEDGTILAGYYEGKPLYATPKDAPLTYMFNQAQEYAEKLDAHGHKDWRAPTKAELNVLFKNRAAIGGFNETGSYPAGWYCSSSQDYYLGAWGQRFSDGYQYDVYMYSDSSLRCVR
jgi:hypothetical protein